MSDNIQITHIEALENHLRNEYMKAIRMDKRALSNLLSQQYDTVARYRRALQADPHTLMPLAVQLIESNTIISTVNH